MFGRKYRLIDIARQIDRDKSTIIRWEELGLIPYAARDSRGWRYYSEEQAKEIVSRVRETNYFHNNGGSDGVAPRHTPKMVYIGVVLAVAFMAWQLFFAGHRVAADTSNERMYATVTAGLLDIVSASGSNSFTSVAVSFSAQTSTANRLGAIRASDARGSGAGWTLALSGTDWKAGEAVKELDYDGLGSNNDTGKLCLMVASGQIYGIAGQGTSNINKGSHSCFSASVTSMTIYQATTGYGKGDYWITDFSLQQRIPSNPTATEYTTTLTLTLS